MGDQAGLAALPTLELAVARTLAEAADAEETYDRVLADIGIARVGARSGVGGFVRTSRFLPR